MSAWPFLLRQKPIIRAPVLQTFTPLLALWPASRIVAVFVTVVQPLAGGVSFIVYVNVRDANGAASVAVTVPRTPASESLTVIVLFTGVAVVKPNAAVPEAVPEG